MPKYFGTTCLLFTAVCLLFSATVSRSQELKGLTMEEQMQLERLKNSPSYGFITFTFTNVVPQGEFQDNVQTSGQGFSVFGGYTFAPAPISAGGQVDVIFNGSDTKYFGHWRTGGWFLGQDTVETQNMLIPITAFLKMQPQVGDFLFPYMEAFAGVNILSSSGTLKPLWGHKDTKSQVSAAFVYGAGAGIGIKFGEVLELPDTHTKFLIDIKARYAKGSETDYYRAERINSDSSVEFKKFRSRTDMVMLYIGLSIMF